MKRPFLRAFLYFWAVPDKLKGLKQIDIIAPITYGSLPNGLILATENHLLKAIGIWRKYPNAKIVFGNAYNCFPGSELVEERLKKKILARNKIPEDVFLQSSIKNTVTEAWGARDLLNKVTARHRVIVVITGLIHSRGARYIWRKTFPASRIIIYCPTDTIETQPNQIIVLQQSPWRWVLANVARQLFLRVLGLERTSQFTHPTTKPA